MDKNKIAIIGSRMDKLASLVSLRLQNEMKSGVLVVCDRSEPVLETFEFKPVKIEPMPFSRKEKSPYKCDGTFKRRR